MFPNWTSMKRSVMNIYDERNLIKCQQSQECCSSSTGWHIYPQFNSLQWNPWHLPPQSPECGRPLAQFSGRDLDHFGLWKESYRKGGHRATLPWPRYQHKIQCIPSWPQSLGPCKKEFHRRLWVSSREARWWKSQSQWSSPWCWTNGIRRTKKTEVAVFDMYICPP